MRQLGQRVMFLRVSETEKGAGWVAFFFFLSRRLSFELFVFSGVALVVYGA